MSNVGILITACYALFIIYVLAASGNGDKEGDK